MILVVGKTYNVSHPRAGQFTAFVELVTCQVVEGVEDAATWVRLRVIGGEARSLAFRQPITAGGTLEIEASRAEFFVVRA